MFCSHQSENFVDNVKHMSIAHSFFIPDADYLVDMEGLLVYLADKITKGTTVEVNNVRPINLLYSF